MLLGQHGSGVRTWLCQRATGFIRSIFLLPAACGRSVVQCYSYPILCDDLFNHIQGYLGAGFHTFLLVTTFRLCLFLFVHFDLPMFFFSDLSAFRCPANQRLFVVSYKYRPSGLLPLTYYRHPPKSSV